MTKYGELSVVHCAETGEVVLAAYEGEPSAEYGGWLHLHNDTNEQDRAEAEAYNRESGAE